MKNYKTGLIFGLVVFLQILTIAFFASKKGGLFVDELWTFNLANSYYLPFVDEADKYFNVFLDRKFFLDAMLVADGKEFEYGSVFYNQSKDVHPPLYYLIVHTICSINKSASIKWVGVCLNILLFVSAQIFLFKIVNLIGKSKNQAIVTCLFYGFSLGAISTVLFIRMYMLLTLLLLMGVYFNLSFIKSMIEKDNLVYRDYWSCIGIFFSYFCGFLTQYYFLVYAFFLSLFVGLFIIFFSKIKNAFIYAGATILPIILGVGIFPSCVSHIVGGGYRGSEAVRNLKRKKILVESGYFLDLLNTDTCILLFIFVLLVIFVYFVFKGRNFDNDGVKGYFWPVFLNGNSRVSLKLVGYSVIFLFFVVSFFLIAKIAAYREPRYIYALYPLVFVLLVSALSRLLNGFSVNKKIIVYVFLFLMCVFLSLHAKKMKFMYPNEPKIIKDLKCERVNMVVSITSEKKWYPVADGLRYFKEFNRSYFISEKDLNVSVQGLDDKIALIVAKNMKNGDAVVGRFMNANGYKQSNFLYDGHEFKLYELKK